MAFGKVTKAWQPHTGDTEKLLLNYEMNETGLILYRSPLLIGPKKLNKQEVVGQILANRTFDSDTRKKARLIAANWSLDYLAEQYFTWIETDGVTPKDPRPHFLAFIRTHRERNGDG